MEVKVLYFASIREKINKDFEIIKFTGKSTQDLRILLANKYPQIKEILSVSKIAVNGKYYEGDLKEGDTVANIPPVSGG